jgi:hypothetical protein
MSVHRIFLRYFPKELRSATQYIDNRLVLRKVKYFWKCFMGSDPSAEILYLLKVESETYLCFQKYFQKKRKEILGTSY